MASESVVARATTTVTDREAIVSVRDLKKHFPIVKGLLRRRVGAVRAVDGISFDIYPGETLGLVGESGSGKSTAGRAVLNLEIPTEGTVVFEGRDLSTLSTRDLRKLRPKMQMVFQNPHSSLNPRMTVGSIIGEPLVEHRPDSNKRDRRQRIEELLTLVGLDPSHANRYPHEFSGGSANASGSRGRSRSTPTSSCATSRSLPSTSRSRPRS